MTLTYGELFAGYDGLGMGVRSVLGGTTSWFAEYEAAPSKILAHHNPDVPNLGDVTKIDWASVPKVDVITGGSPCQDLSHAGKRKGMTDGTRSNLWVEMREAIAVIRPRLVVWENVRGALSASAASDLEPCPGCMGSADDGGPSLRALGRVAGDLAELGYDARWYGLRAADVGGAHGRFRVFLFGTPADAGSIRWGEGSSDGSGSGATSGAGQAGGTCGHSVLGTDPAGVTLLPTPAVNDMGAGKTVDAWGAWTDRMKSEHGNGNGHGKSLHIEAQRLLPTPRATDGTKGGPNQRGSSGDLMLPSAVHLLPTPSADFRDRSVETGNNKLDVTRDFMDLGSVAATDRWREYAAAIARAEHATGRTAPPPTETGPKGTPRLSPAFVEWLMMLPAGHVTDPAIGLTRNDQLKALGNGVVPNQAAAATRAFVADVAEDHEKSAANFPECGSSTPRCGPPTRADVFAGIWCACEREAAS